jgi:hypothetical protein
MDSKIAFQRTCSNVCKVPKDPLQRRKIQCQVSKTKSNEKCVSMKFKNEKTLCCFKLEPIKGLE